LINHSDEAREAARDSAYITARCIRVQAHRRDALVINHR